MRKLLTVTSMCALLGLCACVPTTLHPLYTKNDLVIDSALVGIWGEEGDDERSIFEQSGSRAYTLTHVEDSTETRFDAHLVRLGDEVFLDLSPTDPDCELSGIFEFHTTVLHSFFHVQQIEPVLRLSAMDYGWLQDHLKANPESIAHEVVNHRIILTASTADLQAFILRHVRTEGAFEEAEELSRLDE